MAKLENTSRSRLLEAFHDATEAKAVKRLVVALAYLDGESVDALAGRYEIPRSTIYAWLDRFEGRSIEDALHDQRRPGRPAELDPGEFVHLASDIEAGARAHGFRTDDWTASRLKTHISAVYGVEYSEGHARRLLRQLRPRPDE
jgi:transposase